MHTTCTPPAETVLPAAQRAPAPRPGVTRRRLRLAYLTTTYPKVSHTFIRRELLELESRGHDVLRLAVRAFPEPLAEPADQREAARTRYCLGASRLRLLWNPLRTVVRHPVGCGRALWLALRMGWRGDRGLLRHLAYLVEAAHFLAVLEDEAVQHVHVHFGTNPSAVARLIRRMGGPPYSLTIHGPDEFDAPRGLDLAGKIADAEWVAAISNYTAAQLRRWADVRGWPKIHVVRCGIGPEFLHAAQPLAPEARGFVCVGRLCPQKGQLLLLEALRRLHDEGRPVTLVLAGDGELRGLVEERIRALHLQEHVEITGWISEAEVRRRILEARALVLPSFAEGLPVVLMEALALERPVISTYVAGIPELVRPGENGWLVPAGNVAELAAAMRAALETAPDRLAAMGAAGRQRVLAQHHLGTEVDKLEALLTRNCV